MKRHKRNPSVVDHRGNQDIIEEMIRKWYCTDNHLLITNVRLIQAWDARMARKKYRLELIADFDDEANHEIMLGIAKQYARDLLGSAMLLQDNRKPAVALMTDDAFHGPEEIELLDESSEIHNQ